MKRQPRGPATGPHTGKTTQPSSWRKWSLLLAAMVAVLTTYQAFNLGESLTLDQLQASRDALQAWQATHPWQAAGLFFLVYVAATAVSLPGATILTLAGAALFGFWTGLVLISFASSLGALLAFWVARFLLRDTVQARLGRTLRSVNEGVERDGAWYLLSLRLVPLFPFWLINLAMGVTPMRAALFYWVSQLGMLPGTVVYVNAGTQLGSITSVSDILSPTLIGSFVLLGLFPLAARFGVRAFERRRVYAGWQRPKRFDRNLIVIGAGAGGLVSAYIAAAVRAKVTLVEKGTMGGDCLNTGCVPSKALIHAARLVHQQRQAHRLGLEASPVKVNFAAVMQRVQRAVAAIAPHDSVERYTALGVDVRQGHAELLDPWRVRIREDDGTEHTLSARHIVLATGAEPIVPPLPGLADCPYATSDTLWQWREAPRRLVVLGGGPIGCELAQAFARLGTTVVQVEMGEHLLAREDVDAGEFVRTSLQADDVQVLTRHRAVRVEPHDDAWQLVVHDLTADCERCIPFDQLLCAVGRRARTEGFGLERLGIDLRANGTIATDAWLQTRYPNILAVGDATGPLQFTHAAAHQAWHAAVNALFGRFRRFRVDDRVMPRVTFTDPEVASVGLTEQDAAAQEVAVEVTRFDLAELDRAIVDDVASGYVKVLTVPGKDRILGVTIVGAHAGEWLSEYVLAMKHGLGLNRILGTVHAYPTLAEANKSVAGNWKSTHAPQRVLRWLERYHTWERRD